MSKLILVRVQEKINTYACSRSRHRCNRDGSDSGRSPACWCTRRWRDTRAAPWRTRRPPHSWICLTYGSRAGTRTRTTPTCWRSAYSGGSGCPWGRPVERTRRYLQHAIWGWLVGASSLNTDGVLFARISRKVNGKIYHMEELRIST